MESAEAELKKLQTALAKSEADHRDKSNQVAAALTAMQVRGTVYVTVDFFFWIGSLKTEAATKGPTNLAQIC